MAALRLMQQGKLALDQDVNQRLVSWKVSENEHTKEKKVTLRRLVSHTAGLTVHGFRGYACDEEVPTLLQVLEGSEPANSAPIRVNVAPGSRWQYSGGGYCVLQQMLTDTARKPFPEIMQELVLRRIGMKLSTFQQPLRADRHASAAAGHRPNGEKVQGRWHTYLEMAAAGLWTTPSDLARFAIELQKSWAGKSARFLSRATARAMLTPQMENYGLGIAVEGRGKSARFSHGGSNEGFRCFLVGIPGRAL